MAFTTDAVAPTSLESSAEIKRIWRNSNEFRPSTPPWSRPLRLIVIGGLTLGLAFGAGGSSNAGAGASTFGGDPLPRLGFAPAGPVASSDQAAASYSFAPMLPFDLVAPSVSTDFIPVVTEPEDLVAAEAPTVSDGISRAADPVQPVPTANPASSAVANPTPVPAASAVSPTSTPAPVASAPTSTPEPASTSSEATGSQARTAPSTTPTTSTTSSGGSTSTSTVSTSAAALNARAAGLLAAMNTERVAGGLAPLASAGDLYQVALARSNDMMTNGYFSHVSPTGDSWITLLNAAKIRVTSGGENLARVSGDEVRSVSVAILHLMDSPTHRANIMNGSYNQVGVAAVTDEHGVTVFTAIFAQR